MNFSRRKRETRVSLIEICGKLIFGGGRNTRSMGDAGLSLAFTVTLTLTGSYDGALCIASRRWRAAT